MTTKIRKNHTSAFKAKVALEAIKEQQSLSELADRFQVHRNQVAQWKRQLLDRAEEVFVKRKASDSDANIKELHAKIGRLTMENESLSIALGRLGDKTAKR
ncbi:MAG: transposase [Deltaproteobacteria bacterium]|nr:transposase [Deltaproteobacteria bacterium]